jgi:hypothetical protein
MKTLPGLRPSFVPGGRSVPSDPVSIGIGVISAIEGVTGLAIGFEAASLVGTALLVGGAITLNYAAQALQKRGQGALGSTALNDNSIKYNERQGIPRKRIIYGTAQVGGALCFEVGKPPYLYHGFLVCAEQVTAFLKMWVGSNEVSLSGIAPNTILTPSAVDGQPDYPNNLKVSFRLGTPDQAIDPLLHADFPNLDASFRQQGTAVVVVRYNYGADYDAFTKLWGQVQKPNPLWLVQGIAIPDPRKAGHILNWNPDDPDSVAEARASWTYSNNASLVTAHYLTQKYGGLIRPSRMDWDKVAKSADFDDDMIPCLDGTYQRRYTIDGVVTMNQGRSDIVSGFIAANRGFVLQSAGKSWPSSAAPRKPIVTIHDKLLTGAVSIRAAKPKRDLLNRVKTRFVAPDREYQEVDGPVLSRPDLQALDGEILDGTLDLPFTLDDRRAQRLAKAFMDNGRLGRQITARVDVSVLAQCSEELIGSAVTWDSNLFSQGNGTFFCTEWGFSDGFSSIDISLIEYSASLETDWDPETDEQPFELADLDVS